MSRMMLRSNGKPPLAMAMAMARSPIRLRPRRQTSSTRTPPGSLIKSQLLPPTRTFDVDKSQLRPEYHTISCELRALTKMVHQELGKGEDNNTLDGDILGGQRSPLFERGRFYDEYTARRNERLKRKKGEMEGYGKKSGYDLGVRVESARKRETTKLPSRRKTATPDRPTPRYSLRSTTTTTTTTTSKENKKPPLPPIMMMSVEKSVGITETKMGTRRVRKI